MVPAIGLLLQALIPVVVDEVRSKIADEQPATFDTPKDVPAKEYVVPVLKAAVIGNLKSKTSWVALAVVLLGALEQNQQILSQLIGSNNVGFAVGVIGLLSLWLRNLTNTSVVEKSTPQGF